MGGLTQALLYDYAVTYLSNHLQNNTGNGRLPSPRHGEKLVQYTSGTQTYSGLLKEETK